MASIREEWRPVIGFEQEYEVSSLGRVRSSGRMVRARGGSTQWRRGRMLSPRVSTQGYTRVALSRRSKREEAPIHRLVAEAFIGPRPERNDINHKNGVKDDNRVSNLEYVTRGENLRHAYGTGLRPPTYGHALLTTEQVRYARKVHGSLTARQIAAELGCSVSAVWRLLNGTTWRHV